MSLTPMLFVHIAGATIGLLSGYAAMLFRKGSGWHGAAGTVFFVSMAAMSSSAAYVAIAERPNALNAVVGCLTFYLVTTSWRAARRREGTLNGVDIVAFLYILAVGATGIAFGFEAAGSPRGMKDHMPAFIYFMFGTIALLCAVNDVRMLRRGNLTGTYRIARHLWRMCVALLIATLSLYPGQAKLFPMAIRETNLLYVPHVLLVGSMILAIVRVRRRRRAQEKHNVATSYPAAMANA